VWFWLALLAAVFYASLWLFARASKGMPSSLVTAIQFSPGPVLLAATAHSVDFPWHEPSWYVFLVSQFVIIAPLAWALNHVSQRIEVTLIKPLSGISSISALIFGSLAFGEHFSSAAIFGIAVSTAGLLLLYHARWSVWKSPYPWIVLLAVIFFGVNATLMGHVLSYWHHPVVMSGLAMTSSCIFALFHAVRSYKHMVWTPQRVKLMVSFTAAMLAQELSTQYALALAPGALVVSVKRTSIIMAAAAGYWLFHERDIPLRKLLLSTILVCCGVLLLFWR